MTFLVEVVLETVLRTLVWTGIVAAIAAAATGAVIVIGRPSGRPASWSPAGWFAAAGTAVAIALPERFGWPPGPSIDVWRWDVPILWAAGGAILGAFAGWAFERRAARTVRSRPEEAA
jgi:hypothetical protein